MKYPCSIPHAASDRPHAISIRHLAFGIRHSSPAAFTLIELVICLTIVVLLAAASIPTFRGFQDERLAREPVTALVRLAKEARLRAMQEKRPYQIAFHSGGFTASRYFNPYLQRSELDEFLQLAETSTQQPEVEKTDIDNGGGLTKTTELPLAPPRPKFDEHWTDKYEAPADMKVAIQFWHDTEPLYLEGEVIKLWVFQPSGVCQPLKVHVERQTATFDVEFAALTADIVREVVDLR